MQLANRKLSLGDRVRRNGFPGVLEVTRVFEDGSLVDIKHLDLCGPNFVEIAVPASDLTFLCASRRPAIFVVPSTAAAHTPRQLAVRRQPKKLVASEVSQLRVAKRIRAHA